MSLTILYWFRVADDEILVLGRPGARSRLAGLTAAEQEVTVRALAGRSARNIAADLGKSERTVANQLASVFRKLGVASRSELAALLMTWKGEVEPRS